MPPPGPRWRKPPAAACKVLTAADSRPPPAGRGATPAGMGNPAHSPASRPAPPSGLHPNRPAPAEPYLLSRGPYGRKSLPVCAEPSWAHRVQCDSIPSKAIVCRRRWLSVCRQVDDRHGCGPQDGERRRSRFTERPRPSPGALASGICPRYPAPDNRHPPPALWAAVRARRSRARSAGASPPHTPCWPMSQCRSDSTRHSPRTRQLVQTAIAAAASSRALAGSTLTGNHWSGSRPLSAHLAYPITWAHKAWSTAAPRRSGCGGWVVTPSRVRLGGTIRARGMPGEAVICSLLLRRLRSTLPGHPGPGIRPGLGGQLPAEAVTSSLAAGSRVAHCRQRESAMGANRGDGAVLTRARAGECHRADQRATSQGHHGAAFYPWSWTWPGTPGADASGCCELAFAVCRSQRDGPEPDCGKLLSSSSVSASRRRIAARFRSAWPYAMALSSAHPPVALPTFDLVAGPSLRRFQGAWPGQRRHPRRSCSSSPLPSR